MWLLSSIPALRVQEISDGADLPECVSSSELAPLIVANLGSGGVMLVWLRELSRVGVAVVVAAPLCAGCA